MEGKKIEDVVLEDLQAFIQDLYEKGITARSQARIISGLRAFYKFLLYDGTLTDDPTALLDAPKIGLHLPDVLSVEEIESIISVIDLTFAICALICWAQALPSMIFIREQINPNT